MKVAVIECCSSCLMVMSDRYKITVHVDVQTKSS